MKIKFMPAKTHPQESGKYFWANKYGEVMLVRVSKQISFFSNKEDWWGIAEFNGRNVEAFDVEQFSEKVEFIL